MKNLNLNLKSVNVLVFGMFFIAFLFFTASIFAQDIIIKNDKTEIKVKVLEIQEQVIKYKLFDYQSGPVRNINVSDVFMIIYENGARETFNVPEPSQQPVQVQQPIYEQPVQEYPVYKSVKPKPDYLHNGFCYALKAGLFIPSSKAFSEIYGSGFMWGGSIGYWVGRWGIVFDYKMLSKKGNPYTTGQVTSATSRLKLFPLTFTNYFTIVKEGDFETYLGLGIGPCFYYEYISMTAFGQSASSKVDLTTFELNLNLGMNISHFYMEFSLLSIPLLDYGTNVGGILFSVGVFL